MTSRVVLLGQHIGYSASPAMHAAAFAALGIDARYDLADVDRAGLADAVAALRGEDHLGANVTQPHKLAVGPHVDDRAPEVERLGATNTIVRDGMRLIAHNTDLPAIRAEIAELAEPGTLRRAVVLGAGGASRAVQAALADDGVDVEVVDRATWGTLPHRLPAADLLVNATPIGTESDDSPVPPGLLRDDLAVLDLVYRPATTRLVRDARAAGATAASGIGVLVRQGALSFTLWTGRPAPVGVMRDAVLHELAVPTDA